MTQKRLPVKDLLAAIDMGAMNVWDELDVEERKQVSFWLLNRYASSVNGKREDQELAVFKTNEYYNKNYMVVSKHQKLMWQLLCQAGNTGKIQFHQWIGFKKKSGKANDDGVKLLSRIYPNMKQDEMENLVSISTNKELKELAEEHGIESKK
mgnify:FL=1|tara:strand:- start:1927 stop:2382 length:456 start_codon:yes stop_codon:yes gene_type:complete